VSVSRRFAFRLASVQRLRRWSEEQSSIALRRQIDRWRDALDGQQTLERAAEAARGALATESAAGVSAATLRLLADGVRDVTARAKEAAAQTQTEATAVDARRSDLTDAAQARRTIDRLEEIQHGIWRTEATRAEQKITDEVASRQRGNT
jgi:flagellar export protein FliJ